MDAGCGSGQLGMTVRFVDTNVEAVELHGDVLLAVGELDLLIASDLHRQLLEAMRRKCDDIAEADDLVGALAALSVLDHRSRINEPQVLAERLRVDLEITQECHFRSLLL